MPHVRILHGSQAGAIAEQDETTASVSVTTGFAEYVEAVDGQWQAASRAVVPEAPATPRTPEARTAKPATTAKPRK
jgi:hypothetical protein